MCVGLAGGADDARHAGQGAVDLESVDDASMVRAIEAQIASFGQCPSRLLKVPHPNRNANVRWRDGRGAGPRSRGSCWRPRRPTCSPPPLPVLARAHSREPQMAPARWLWPETALETALLRLTMPEIAPIVHVAPRLLSSLVLSINARQSVTRHHWIALGTAPPGTSGSPLPTPPASPRAARRSMAESATGGSPAVWTPVSGVVLPFKLELDYGTGGARAAAGAGSGSGSGARHILGDPMEKSVRGARQCYAVPRDGRAILTCGYWDGTIRVFEAVRARTAAVQLTAAGSSAPADVPTACRTRIATCRRSTGTWMLLSAWRYPLTRRTL